MSLLHFIFVIITVCLVILSSDYTMATGLHRITTRPQSLGHLMRDFEVIIAS